MIRRPIRLPLTLVWAAVAASAFAGTYFGDGRVAAAMFAAAAVAAYGSALYYRFRIRAELRALERKVGIESDALAMGRRAPWIMLTVTEPDGSFYARTLAQILRDATPEGRDMIWDAPTSAALWYMDPDGAYVRDEHAEHH